MNVNKFVDTIQQSIQEVGSISSTVSSYSFTGTNTPYITLNNKFVTNMQTDITDACMDKIFIPTIRAMKAEGRPFVGVLFVG